ncbi:GNAT family N-acetyltransferase [Bacillus sp. BP-3]|uniref:GNAT family N-acetyltransferase n=1 Tax=Bacillus sp. BP-3 TaxID=3022773 RepID=UPI00232E454C|nr:GNAT family N-acetyltransferase [Bacillus sp. BP-3]MDC2864355.1 GNAT family N-acetyltransferase [Bacillus sp. BP-3]
MLLIEKAKLDDIQWINFQYEQVDFVPSHLENEEIAIAYFNSQKSGLGRLVKIDENNFELGGIYTLEEYRGKNIADSIVAFLIKEARKFQIQNVYCIPFEHLKPFYSKHGFQEVVDLVLVPQPIIDKYNWCLEQYDTKTLLMKL